MLCKVLSLDLQPRHHLILVRSVKLGTPASPPDPQDQKLWGWNLTICVFNKPSRGLGVTPKLENHQATESRCGVCIRGTQRHPGSTSAVQIHTGPTPDLPHHSLRFDQLPSCFARIFTYLKPLLRITAVSRPVVLRLSCSYRIP